MLEQDIIYVGGGNTKNLIALWKEWGLNQILRDAGESEIILCGLSVGSICWFEEAESRGVFRDGVSPSQERTFQDRCNRLYSQSANCIKVHRQDEKVVTAPIMMEK